MSSIWKHFTKEKGKKGITIVNCKLCDYKDVMTSSTLKLWNHVRNHSGIFDDSTSPKPEKEEKSEELKKANNLPKPEEAKTSKPEEAKKSKSEEAKKSKPEEAKKSKPEEAKKSKPEEAKESSKPKKAKKLEDNAVPSCSFWEETNKTKSKETGTKSLSQKVTKSKSPLKEINKKKNTKSESKNSFKSNIIKHKETKEALLKTQVVHLTVDAKAYYCKSFLLVIIGHFKIEKTINRKILHFSLDFENLCETIFKVIKDWNITSKVRTIVFDDRQLMDTFNVHINLRQNEETKCWTTLLYFEYELKEIIEKSIQTCQVSYIRDVNLLLQDLDKMSKNYRTTPNSISDVLDQLTMLTMSSSEQFKQIIYEMNQIFYALSEIEISIISEITPTVRTAQNNLDQINSLLNLTNECLELRKLLWCFLDNYVEKDSIVYATFLDPKYAKKSFLSAKLNETRRKLFNVIQKNNGNETNLTLQQEIIHYSFDVKNAKEIDESTDSILWWNDIGCKKYPQLSMIAFEYLSIPISIKCSKNLIPETR